MSVRTPRRSVDIAIKDNSAVAIAGLETLIVDAVRSSDDDRVTELDNVLKAVETMVGSANGRRRTAR